MAGGRGFATDATLIYADADEWQRGQINEETAPRFVREYLKTLGALHRDH